MQNFVTPMRAAPPVRALTTYLLSGNIAQLVSQQRLKLQYHLWHGLLALEAGNLPPARRQFQLARFYPIAELYGQDLGR